MNALTRIFSKYFSKSDAIKVNELVGNSGGGGGKDIDWITISNPDNITTQIKDTLNNLNYFADKDILGLNYKFGISITMTDGGDNTASQNFIATDVAQLSSMSYISLHDIVSNFDDNATLLMFVILLDADKQVENVLYSTIELGNTPTPTAAIYKRYDIGDVIKVSDGVYSIALQAWNGGPYSDLKPDITKDNYKLYYPGGSGQGLQFIPNYVEKTTTDLIFHIETVPAGVGTLKLVQERYIGD